MSRNNDRKDSKRYYDWLYKAAIDILSARELQINELCYASSAFHCQQCVEKALKAYLLYSQKRLVDGHNLTWLCRQAVKVDKSFRQWLDECSYLNRYYIETRYPADIALVIEKKTIERVYNMAKEMFDFICEHTGFRFERYRNRGAEKAKEIAKENAQ